MQAPANAPAPTSLENLHPVVPPDPVPLWPPAPGWYVVIAVVLVASVVTGWRAWLRRRDDSYRREALAELQRCETKALPDLLRRAALSAWPRNRIAALTGQAWHRFLDQSMGATRFEAGAGALLDTVAYRGADTLRQEQAEALRSAVRDWLRTHRRDADVDGDAGDDRAGANDAPPC
jgi:hypothetical protein